MSDVVSLAVTDMPRPITCVRRGWHIEFSDGRWRLVDTISINPHGRKVHVSFVDNVLNPVTYVNTATVRTRTPAEQMRAVLVEERQRKRLFQRAFYERRKLTRLVEAIWARDDADAGVDT